MTGNCRPAGSVLRVTPIGTVIAGKPVLGASSSSGSSDGVSYA